LERNFRPPLLEFELLVGCLEMSVWKLETNFDWPTVGTSAQTRVLLFVAHFPTSYRLAFACRRASLWPILGRALFGLGPCARGPYTASEWLRQRNGRPEPTDLLALFPALLPHGRSSRARPFACKLRLILAAPAHFAPRRPHLHLSGAPLAKKGASMCHPFCLSLASSAERPCGLAPSLPPPHGGAKLPLWRLFAAAQSPLSFDCFHPGPEQ